MPVLLFSAIAIVGYLWWKKPKEDIKNVNYFNQAAP